VTKCHRLKPEAADGKKYLTDVADPETLLRLIPDPARRLPVHPAAFEVADSEAGESANAETRKSPGMSPGKSGNCWLLVMGH